MLGEMILNLTCTPFFSEWVVQPPTGKVVWENDFNHQTLSVPTDGCRWTPYTAEKTYDELGQKGEGVSFLVVGRMVGSGGSLHGTLFLKG